MLNSTNIKLGSNSQTVQFNSPSSGILQRSHPKSIFLRFQINSNLEEMVFPSDGTTPYIHKHEYNSIGYTKYKESQGKIEVTVLQVLIFGNNYYLVEVVELQYLNDLN